VHGEGTKTEMTPQNVTPEMKAQMRAQLERLQKALGLKEEQIRLKRERAKFFNRQAHLQKEDGEDLSALLDYNEEYTLTNAANMLDLELEEFRVMVDQVGAQLRALESNIHVVGALQPQGKVKR
jgi:hypothetical protein